MVVFSPPVGFDISDYVQITSDASLDNISNDPIVMNLAGLTITNNLTTYIGLTAQTPALVNVFNVNVTKDKMAGYFTSDANFDTSTFLHELSVNVRDLDIIGGAPSAGDATGKRSFSTGCIGVTGEYYNLNLIEAVIKYVSKLEVNSDLAYLVMAPGSIAAVSNQLATFGTLAVANCADNVAVPYSICKLLWDMSNGSTGNGGRTMTNATTIVAETFVFGDTFLISGSVRVPTKQNQPAFTGFTAKTIADFPFTLQITITAGGLGATGRSSTPYYNSLVYSATAPSGSYSVESTNYNVVNSDTSAKTYSYGEAV
jgi:hypothetical protein